MATQLNIAGYGLLLAVSISAIGMPLAAQCPNIVVPAVEQFWATRPYMRTSELRDYLAGFFNLQEDNWNAGWGWARYNNEDGPSTPFGRMLTSSELLRLGLADNDVYELFASQGAWSATTMAAGADTWNGEFPLFSAVSPDPESVQVVYRNAIGKLVSVSNTGDPWDAGERAPIRVTTVVSDAVATTKSNFHISSPPVAVAQFGGAIHAYARAGDALLQFKRSPLGDWSVEEPTSLLTRPSPEHGNSRFFISTDPVVLRHNGHAVSVFALDAFRHLIRYYWDDGVWLAQDLSSELGVPLHVASDPVPIISDNGTIHIFARSTDGTLMHFYSGPTGLWKFEEIKEALQGLPDEGGLQGLPSAAMLFGETVTVYYRVSDKLYAVTQAPGTGWHRKSVAHEFTVASQPQVMRRGPNRVDGLFLDRFQRLVHFYFRPVDGNGAEVVWEHPVSGNPVMVSAVQERLDVFFRSSEGHLRQSQWTPVAKWQHRNVSLEEGVSVSQMDIGASLTAVARGNRAISVMAPRAAFANRTVHFVSAVGLTVNTWHTNYEYSRWAAGSKHDFQYRPLEIDGDANATAYRSYTTADQVTVQCPGFELPSGELAGTMLHESTHMIHWRWKHQDNLFPDACSDPCSDRWYYHALRDSDARIGGDEKNHSMNQIKIEFLADFGEFPDSTLPLGLFFRAVDEAGDLMTQRILNPPGWRPGRPRPIP